MADIELAIKIPEEMYKWVCDVNKFSNDYGTGDFIDLIKNGALLPKEHGDLIDKNELIKRYKKDCGRRIYVDNFIFDLENNTTVIIPTDKDE